MIIFLDFKNLKLKCLNRIKKLMIKLKVDTNHLDQNLVESILITDHLSIEDRLVKYH